MYAVPVYSNANIIASALWRVIRHCEALANTVEGYIAARLEVSQGHQT